MSWVYRIGQRLQGSSGWLATGLVALLIGIAPAWLFSDALWHSRLRVDDFAYVADSRTLARALANLFEPRNAHVVPAWRLLTWGVVAAAGRLTNLPAAFAWAASLLLAATMALMGLVVARETGRGASGLAAMAALGTTALMEPAATWYSAAQATAAGAAILGMIWWLQAWRLRGGGHYLVLAGIVACLAGWTWTIGYAAGPVGAAYLWADGRPRARRAAAIPLAVSTVALALALGLGGSRIDATTSFHGLTVRQAFHPMRGVVHTLQVIPEELVLGNLGVSADTTVAQGALFSAALAAAWAWSRRGRGAIVPLEAAGATLVLLAYLVEWSARGYLPFDRSLREVVGWYDTVPQVGAVLFVAGWCTAGRVPSLPGAVHPPARASLLGVLLLEAALLIAQTPRTLAQFERSLPPMTAEEAKRVTTPEVRRLRALIMAEDRAQWQSRHLAKLERVEARARQLGIGRRVIHETFGRLRAPELPKPEVYDALGLLDLPWDDLEREPGRVRTALGPLLTLEPEPPSVLARAALAVPAARP